MSDSSELSIEAAHEEERIGAKFLKRRLAHAHLLPLIYRHLDGRNKLEDAGHLHDGLDEVDPRNYSHHSEQRRL